MEISNEYLVGNWAVSSSIINFILAISCKVRIYLVLANKESDMLISLTLKLHLRNQLIKAYTYINLQLWHAHKTTSCKHNCNPWLKWTKKPQQIPPWRMDDGWTRILFFHSIGFQFIPYLTMVVNYVTDFY